MTFNMPSTLTHVQGGATYSYTYTYNTEHERVKLVTVRPDNTLTSVYVHPAGKGALLYEKQTRQSDGLVENRHYVSAGAGLVGVFVTKSFYGTGDGPEMRYYLRDYVGSVAAIANPAAAVIERLGYEAYGERRYANGSPENRQSPLIGITTNRGFTAHEHLDEMMLIHMNGRIFDPILARFMTPDAFVTNPRNLQSFNRYSYALNNPLAYIDPTGYANTDEISYQNPGPKEETVIITGSTCADGVCIYRNPEAIREIWRDVQKQLPGYTSYSPRPPTIPEAIVIGRLAGKQVVVPVTLPSNNASVSAPTPSNQNPSNASSGLDFAKWAELVGIDAGVVEQLAGKMAIGTNWRLYDVPRGNQYFSTLVEVGKIANAVGVGTVLFTSIFGAREVIKGEMPLYQLVVNDVIGGVVVLFPASVGPGAMYLILSNSYPGGREAYNAELSRILNITEGGGR